MRTVLHLGAHKTATTSLQQSLLGSRRALAARRIVAPKLPELRAGLTKCVFQAQQTGEVTEALTEQSRAFLASFDQHDCLILSDENFLGSPRQVLRSTQLYPFAATRLTHLSQLLGTREVEIFLSLRESAGFLRALYVEALKNGYYRPLDQVTQAFTRTPPDWLHLIDTIREVFPAARLTLWDHADFNDLTDQVLSTMAGMDIPWTHPETRHRVTPGAAATQALINLARTEGQPALIKAAPALIAQNPSPRPAFAPWSRRQKNHLAKSYATQIATLKARTDLRWLT